MKIIKLKKLKFVAAHDEDKSSDAKQKSGDKNEDAANKRRQQQKEAEKLEISTDDIAAAEDSREAETAPAAKKRRSEKKADKKAASEKAGSEKTASEKAASGKTASDKAASGKTASDKAASGKNADEKDASKKNADEKDASKKNAVEKDAESKKRKAKDKSISIIQIIATLLIAMSIILMSLPFINAALIRRYSRLNLNAITAAEMKENAMVRHEIDNDSIESIGVVNIWPWLNNYDEKAIVGQLTIPKLNINLAVFNAGSNENQLAGVCYLKSDQQFGQGNFALSGHRAKGKGVLLHNLMDADIGDRINLTDKEMIYVYKIVDTLQVDTDAVEMIEDSQVEKYDGKPLISIMTCYFGKSSSRWFVIGTLEKIIPYSAPEQTSPDI